MIIAAHAFPELVLIKRFANFIYAAFQFAKIGNWLVTVSFRTGIKLLSIVILSCSNAGGPYPDRIMCRSDWILKETYNEQSSIFV